MFKNHKRTFALARNSLALAYAIFTFPLALIFIKNEHVRFTNDYIVSHWASKIRPPTYVFVGDSITAGGRSWQKLDSMPFNTINLAGNGYTIRQISSQVSEALKYSPDYVLIMAGTNDILSDASSVDEMTNDYRRILEQFDNSKSVPIITLVPFTSKETHRSKIQDFNEKILDLSSLEGIKTIDLNAEIAPSRLLLTEFTVDGVHLSERAYDIWTQQIRSQVHP